MVCTGEVFSFYSSYLVFRELVISVSSSLLRYLEIDSLSTFRLKYA